MKSLKPFLLCTSLFILLTGCQEDSEHASSKDKEANHPEETTTVSKEVDISSITPEEWISADPGELYQKYIKKQSWSKNPKEYKAATGSAIDHYIDSVDSKETEQWNEKEWAHSILSSLQTGYRDIASELENYEVVYDELKLPDGRLLQDIEMDEITQKQDKKVNVAFLIDSSGSMKAKVDGESKMSLTKESLARLAEELPDSVNVSLIAFGHKGTGSDADKEMSCKAVESFYPLQPYDVSAFSDSLNKFDPKGWTPLASSIELANEQLSSQSDENTENFIYVVSDGIETCDGNPVAAAQKVKEDNTNVKINIIGFDVDTEADEQLKRVAETGGGEYSSVKTKQQLSEIENVWKEAINKNTWRWWAVNRFSDNVWTTVDHYYALRGIVSTYQSMLQNEDNRLSQTLNQLEKDSLIDSEKRSAISSLLDDRQEKIRNYLADLESEKHEEVKTVSDELDKKLDAIEEQVGI
ncbi:VWA domain-containing protein [Rossellomorea aquimaris]|uniref:vWA domain-containing protein n=1 Tax=Rossellomorea aquimaris TaxID=189382 RepID=UPI001CD466A4|nr:VWA domain-containing protein [Rossellomorea aquimaris]MCA1061576.1 VWA domain-containing protein [Rossellomorea aquimaris]